MSTLVVHYSKDRGYADTKGNPIDFDKVKSDAKAKSRNVEVINLNDRTSDYTIINRPVLPKSKKD